jgi:hypothetical protein
VERDVGRHWLEELQATQRAARLPPPRHTTERHLEDIKLLLMVLAGVALFAFGIWAYTEYQDQNQQQQELQQQLDRAGQQLDRQLDGLGR